MRKKMFIWHIMYYILSLLIYAAFFYLSSLMLRLSGDDDLGTVMAVTYAFLFVGTPIMIILIMRFSLLKWYVDPIASAEIPLFLYLAMVLNQGKHTGALLSAFKLVNQKLCDDGGEGWLFLIGLFIFGLITSFSLARKHGQSISYRLISKLSHN